MILYDAHIGRDPGGIKRSEYDQYQASLHFSRLSEKTDWHPDTYIYSPKVPSLVMAEYLGIPVETYISNPPRCIQFQKFGHHKTKCQHKIICARCGEEGHEDKSCAKSEHSANCQGDNPAYSKVCSK